MNVAKICGRSAKLAVIECIPEEVAMEIDWGQ